MEARAVHGWKVTGESAAAGAEAAEKVPEEPKKVIIEGSYSLKEVTVAKEAGFVETNEDDVGEVLTTHDQDLTDEELMPLQEQKIQMETKHHTKQHKNEFI